MYANMNKKGITTIVAVVLLLMIGVGSATLFYIFSSSTQSKTQSIAEKMTTEETQMLKEQATTCIKIENVVDNKIFVRNCGSGIVDNNTIAVYLDSIPLDITVPRPIKPKNTGVIYVNLLDDSCKSGDKYELKVATPYMSTSYRGEYPVDFDGDGVKETCVNNKLVEINITDMRSLYLYNGYAAHRDWWPLYVDFSVAYVDAITGEKVGEVEHPGQIGNADFKIVKCVNDGSPTGCTVTGVGNKGTCIDGVVKDYGDLEPPSLQYFRDDNYRDCDSGNPWLIGTRDPWEIGLNRMRIQFLRRMMGGDGKYKLCVKYKMNNGMETPEKCMVFVTTATDVTGTTVPTSQSYGSTITWSGTATVKFDSSKPAYVERKRCRLYLWDWWHDPRADAGKSFTFRRHGSWDKYWSYFGYFFSNKDASTPDKTINVTLVLPSVCRVRHVYHHNCGWWWNVYDDPQTICCEKRPKDTKWRWYKYACQTKEGDEIRHTGAFGETFQIINYIDPSVDSYDDIRTYIECNDPTVFGDDTRKYTVSVKGADHFWVNDMDYTTEMSFSEAFDDTNYQRDVTGSNAADYTCTLTLKICGKARYFAELYDWPLWYGAWWSRSANSYVCVTGPSCPHASC